MASLLKLKKSSVSGKVPLAADLEYGELAINYADGLIFYKTSSNIIESLGAQGVQGTQGTIGPMGDQGIQGTQGTQGTQGRQVTWRGEWAAGTLYNTDDVVYYEGNSFVAVYASQFNGMLSVPLLGASYPKIVNATYWNRMTEQGVQGIQGIFGTQGTQGTLGITGDTGPTGSQGTQGTQGDQGIQGTQGISIQGTQGIQGIYGTQGVYGTQGTQGVQGQALVVRGNWNSVDSYLVNDIVYYLGSSWVAIIPNQGNYQPDQSPSQWTIMSAQGTQGVQGGFGPQGTTGTLMQVSLIDNSNTVSQAVTNVTALRFDSDSGFDVTDLGSGAVKVGMNSTFKTWQVDGQSDLIAQGLDTIEFVAGTGIQITTDPNTTPKSITFTSSGLDNSPLVWSTNSNYRTLTGYKENNITQTIRTAEFSNNLLRITLATFTPTLASANSPSNSLNWDEASQGFNVTVINPNDFNEQYISSVASITATTGSISNLNTFTAGAYSNNPAGTVDWTRAFTTNASSYIRPISTTVTGGSVSATVAFNYYNSTSEVLYTQQNSTFTVNWATPTVSITLASLTGSTFLSSYSNVAYTVTTTGITNSNNITHSITGTGGSVSSATTSGTFTFTNPIHKDNTNTTRNVSTTTILDRPSSVTGTQYSVNVSYTTGNPNATFTYPTLWAWTASTSTVPTRTTFVSGTTFAAGVTQLGNQVKTLAGFINNTDSFPRAFWFAVRTAASQPTTFRTGASAALLSDVGVATGNTVSLQPDSPLAGYNGESYTLYGITLQPGNTYVSIS